MKNTSNKTSNTLPFILGTLAPVLFVLIFTLNGWLQKEYSAISMHISALSIGSRGWIQIGNFLILGTFLCIFSIALWKENTREHISGTGPVILMISALCFLLSGPFVMDPMGTPRENMTTHGIIHGLLGGIVFILMPITCFVFYKQYKKDEKWTRFSSWTFTAGIVITTALVCFTLITKIPSLNKLFFNYQGLTQRAVLVPYMIWLFTFALKKTTGN